jgi:hypothetical protein
VLGVNFLLKDNIKSQIGVEIINAVSHDTHSKRISLPYSTSAFSFAFT